MLQVLYQYCSISLRDWSTLGTSSKLNYLHTSQQSGGWVAPPAPPARRTHSFLFTSASLLFSLFGSARGVLSADVSDLTHSHLFFQKPFSDKKKD